MRNIKLPEGWRVEKLGSFTEIRSGGTPSRNNNKFWENGNIPWLKISDLKTKYIKESEEKITNEAIDKSSAKVFKKGTILYTIFATLGEVAILDIEASTNQAIVGIDIKVENVNKKYLYYFLKSIKEDICGKGRGVAQNNINMSILKNTDVLLPPIETQKKIVEILEHAEKVLEKRKKTIRLIDELVKSQFIEMFGNLKDEEKLSLEKCTTFIDYRGKTPTLSESGIRIINAKSVGNGFFKYIDEYISEETYDSWMKRGFPVAGDVLFVTEGHTFGNVCRIPNGLNKFAMGQRVITMQGKENLLNNVFLAQYMQSMSFKIDIDKYKTGSSAQGIRSKELQKILIPIPNIELQNQFADFVKKIDKLKFEMQESLKELKDNFNSLMQRAFKGELFN